MSKSLIDMINELDRNSFLQGINYCIWDAAEMTTHYLDSKNLRLEIVATIKSMQEVIETFLTISLPCEVDFSEAKEALSRSKGEEYE